MKVKLTKEMCEKIYIGLIISTFTLLLYYVLTNFSVVADFFDSLTAILSPFIFGFVLALCIMTAVALIDYSFLMKFPWLYYALMMGLLIMVELWGKNVNGAQRWLEIGGEDSGITIQPSEFAKIAVILFLAHIIVKNCKKMKKMKV